MEKKEVASEVFKISPGWFSNQVQKVWYWAVGRWVFRAEGTERKFFGDGDGNYPVAIVQGTGLQREFPPVAIHTGMRRGRSRTGLVLSQSRLGNWDASLESGRGRTDVSLDKFGLSLCSPFTKAQKAHHFPLFQIWSFLFPLAIIGSQLTALIIAYPSYIYPSYFVYLEGPDIYISVASEDANRRELTVMIGECFAAAFLFLQGAMTIRALWRTPLLPNRIIEGKLFIHSFLNSFCTLNIAIYAVS